MDKEYSILSINVSVFLLMMGVGLVVAVIPARLLTLTGSVSSIGLSASIFAVPNMLLQMPVGRWADKYGCKTFLVGGYALSALAGLVFYISETPFFLYAGRFIQGAAEVPLWALGPALVSVMCSRQKGMYIGIYNACLHAGLTTGGMLSIFFMTDASGNVSFLIFSTMGVIGAVVTSLFLNSPEKPSLCEHENEEHSGFKSSGFRGIFKNGENRIIMAGILLYGGAYGCFITVVPGFLLKGLNVGEAVVGVYFMVFYIALSISQLFGGKLSDIMGRKPGMMWGLFFAALCLGCFSSLEGAAAILFLFGGSLGLGVFCVSSTAFLNDRVPDSMKGFISGAFYFCWASGYFLGPLVMGRIGDVFSYPVAFSALGAMFASVFVLIMLYVGKDDKNIEKAVSNSG